MIPKSNTIEAAALIEKVLDERSYPCNPMAAARAGYEAAYREFMKISETQSSDKDPDCVKASSEVTSILVDPKATICGHVRYLNKYLPMLDGTKKWAGVFSGAPVVSDMWHCLAKGATLFTSDGIEDVEEGSYYRVLQSETDKSVKILLRKAEYSYPDQKWFLNLIQNQGNTNES